jgi:hypothetical protein
VIKNVLGQIFLLRSFGLGSCVHYPSVLLCHLRSIYVKFDTFSLLVLLSRPFASCFEINSCFVFARMSLRDSTFCLRTSDRRRRRMCRKIFNFLPFFCAAPHIRAWKLRKRTCESLKGDENCAPLVTGSGCEEGKIPRPRVVNDGKRVRRLTKFPIKNSHGAEATKSPAQV